MTSTNFTIDNINPLIQYAPPGAWSEGSDTLDPLGVDYSNGGTFTLSTTQGSSATFTFNGTQVFVNGARRSNHGPYSITLDGTQTTFNGFSADPVFGPLFISDVLPQGLHTVTLTNQENNSSFPFLDLDFITWTSTLPDQGESKTIEDTDSSFTYSPPTSWSSTSLSTLQLTGFSGNSGHTTQTTGASVTVAFSGTFITIFGPVGPNIARYTVQLDGVNAGTFNATKQAYYPQVALFSASGLSDGPHSLELVSQPATSGQILAIDFVQVSPTSTANATASSGSASSTSTSKKSSVGPAVGGAVGGVVVLAILILVICILFRRRRRREEDRNQMALEDKYSVPTAYPMNSSMSVPYAASNNASMPYVPGNNEFMPSNGSMPYNSATTQSQYSTHSQSHLVQQAPYTDGPPSSPLTNPYGGMDSQSSSHGAGAAQRTYRTVNNDDSQLGHRSQLSSSDAGSGSGSGSVGPASTMQSAGAAGLGAGGGNARRSKGGPLPLPPTANVPLPAGAARMYVPGREQDMGPLPPDYEQATEPYRSLS